MNHQPKNNSTKQIKCHDCNKTCKPVHMCVTCGPNCDECIHQYGIIPCDECEKGSCYNHIIVCLTCGEFHGLCCTKTHVCKNKWDNLCPDCHKESDRKCKCCAEGCCAKHLKKCHECDQLIGKCCMELHSCKDLSDDIKI